MTSLGGKKSSQNKLFVQGNFGQKKRNFVDVFPQILVKKLDTKFR